MLALLACLLLQDAPADYLKKVEEKYASAKTLTVNAEIQVFEVKNGKEVEKPDSRMRGILRAKGDGRYQAELSKEAAGKTIPVATYVSDGRTLSARYAFMPTERKDHTLAVGTWARALFARTGLLGSLGSIWGSVVAPEELKLDKLFPVRDVADGGTEKVGLVDCRVLTYTVGTVEDPVKGSRCRVWIDPSRLVVLKREMSTATSVIRETHAETTFDAELADDLFKIP